MLLIALWLQMNAAHAQYGVPTSNSRPGEGARTIEAIESIEKANREMNRKANLPDQKCWMCAFEKAPVCSFGDVCRELKAQSGSNKLYSKSDGTYLPNIALVEDSKVLSQCRSNAVRYLATLPEKFQLYAKKEADREVAFMKFIENRGSEKMYLQVSRALIETAEPNTAPKTDSAAAKIKLEKAEKAAGVKLPEDIKEEWIKFATLEPFNVELPPPIRFNEDPLMDPTSLYLIGLGGTKESVLKGQARYQTQFERAEKIFFKTQKRVVAVLEKRRTDKNSEQIDNMIARVNTVKLAPNLNLQECPSPNGYYYPDRHEISTCPQNLVMPDEVIERTMAHELGHSIDPCNSTNDLTRWKKNSSKKGLAPSGTVYGNVVTFNPKVNDRDPEYSYSAFGGIDKPMLKGIPPGDYPLNSVVKCLTHESSLGAAQGDIRAKIAALKKDIRIKKDSGASDAKIEEMNQSLVLLEKIEADERTKRCGQNGSQLQEAMGDWISAEVLADSLSEDRNEARQAVFEGASGLSPASCELDKTEYSEEALKGISACLEFKTLPNGGGYYAGGGGYGGGYGSGYGTDISLRENEAGEVHPETADRISKILLAHPKIREKIGCPKTAVEHCE